MTPEEIIQYIYNKLSGVVPKTSWGETSLFYNPGSVLPNGVYFCTSSNITAKTTKRQVSIEKVYLESLYVLTPKPMFAYLV